MTTTRSAIIDQARQVIQEAEIDSLREQNQRLQAELDDLMAYHQEIEQAVEEQAKTDWYTIPWRVLEEGGEELSERVADAECAALVATCTAQCIAHRPDHGFYEAMARSCI